MSDEPAWTYESRVTSPFGMTISASIELPQRYAGPDSLELLEVAQMAVNQMAGVTKSIMRSPLQVDLHCGHRVEGTNHTCLFKPGHEGPCGPVEIPF